MSIPRDSRLRRGGERDGHRVPAREVPARAVRQVKEVESEGIATHGIKDHTGSPGDIGAAPSSHSHPPQNNLAATAAPGVTDDSSEGYGVSSHWYDVTNDKAYVCLDATEDAAVWSRISATIPIATDNVSSPPTDAELDTAFGQPSGLGDGFIGVVDDAGAGTTLWLCLVANSAWWYEQLTKAV